MSILIKTSLYLIEWQITTIYDPSTVGVDRRTFFSYFQMVVLYSLVTLQSYTYILNKNNNCYNVTRNSWISKFLNFNFDKYPGRLSDLLFFGKITGQHIFLEQEEQ